MATFAELVDDARRRLERAGIPSVDARRDAALLARLTLGWTTADWLGRMHEQAPVTFGAPFQAAIDRRTRHEPVAYIAGTREFYGREFRVTPAVLIPRPETELLVDEALRVWTTEAPLVVDVGTGSGCVAITLALERPAARVVGTDTSEAALAIARENAERLGASGIDFRLGDLLANTPGPIGLIVSNPPYVAEIDRPSLPREVADYEPHAALFAGAAGFDVIDRLIGVAFSALAPDGVLLLEIGQGQAEAVTARAREAGFIVDAVRRDLQGIPRVVAARRTS